MLCIGSVHGSQSVASCILSPTFTTLSSAWIGQCVPTMHCCALVHKNVLREVHRLTVQCAVQCSAVLKCAVNCTTFHIAQQYILVQCTTVQCGALYKCIVQCSVQLYSALFSFHRIGPLVRFGLVIAMSVRILLVCPLPM